MATTNTAKTTTSKAKPIMVDTSAAPDRSNSGSSLETIIAAIMSNEGEKQQRQAQFIVAMFESTDFGLDKLQTYMKSENKTRAEWRRTVLLRLSRTYELAAAELAQISDSDEKSEAEIIRADNLRSQIRAAEQMFTRVLESLYYLRVNKVQSCKVRKDGAIQVTDNDGDVNAYSGRSLSRVASKRLKADGLRNGNDSQGFDAPKAIAKRVASYRNMSQAFAAFAAAGKGPEDVFKETEVEAFNILVASLIRFAFADDQGTIDGRDVVSFDKEWNSKLAKMVEEANRPKAETKKAAA